MDSLNYHYYAGTNRLRHISDNVDDGAYRSSLDRLVSDIDNQPQNNYAYDHIGNLIKDSAEKITHIKWSVYGKIQEITKNVDGAITTIKYTYDALGNRISKTVIPPSGGQGVTWYVRDAQGNLLSTYSSEGDATDLAALPLKQTDRYLYGSSRLGVITGDANVDGGPADMYDYNGWTFSRGMKQYELTNHLGNVLAVVSDKKFGVPSDTNSSLTASDYWRIDYYLPHIVSATDYYPFGMPSRVAPNYGGPQYKFGFNGKEQDDEVKGWGSQQDYGMRIYDPRVGKFLSIDPLSKGYPMLTPYQFSSNTPIAAIDIDGEEAGIPMNGVGWSGTRLSNYFDNAKGRKVVLKALGTGVVVGGAIVADVFVTKGWMTRTVLMSQVLGAMEHNRAKTPEGRIAQDQRSKAALADAAITWGIGKVLGVGLYTSAEVVKLATNRFNFAKKFYKAAGFSEAQAVEHARGIELTEKVYETTLEKGTIVEQWRRVNKETGELIPGNYYTLPGADPAKLGISLAGREKVTIVLSEDTKFLKSTAADITDTWSVPGKSINVKGGETQLFQTNVKGEIIK